MRHRGIHRELPGRMPGDERARQQEPARAGMLIGAVVAEPGDLRADVAGIQVASAQLPKAMRVHPFSRLIALSLRPSIHPNQGRAHRLPVGVGRDQPVELRAERQRAHRGPVHGVTYLGKRRRDGA